MPQHNEKYSLKILINGILNGDNTLLAKAITLIESSKPEDREKSIELINSILPKTGNSVRIGITGSPGVGKSTFIDSFGSYLHSINKKLAVLTIDPSSSLSSGSILGDKTRMERLSQLKDVYVRTSPSRGSLGGVGRKTREAILLCEAAGYEIILIETIGVGQSEILIRSMVDILILLIHPGGGDELQGLKKGSVELADIIVINKSDGQLKILADQTHKNYENALHLLNSPTEGWYPKVIKVSSIYDEGIESVWKSVEEFLSITKSNSYFEKRRKQQKIEWLHKIIEDEIFSIFQNNTDLKKFIRKIEQNVIKDSESPYSAARKIIEKLTLSQKAINNAF